MRSSGQSLAEFALVLPLLLLLLLFGIDFGRVFLGWVELNNVAREAADFAAQNPVAWNTVNPDTTAQAQYASLVANDAAAIDCTLPSPLPTPSFPNGVNGPNAIGQPVSVSLTCNFGLLTPIIGGIVGNPLRVGATVAFPIRHGMVAGIPVAAVVPPPTPTSGTPPPTCTIPNLLSVKAVNAQATWTAAGFSTPVIFNPLAPATFPPSGGKITSQDQVAGSAQPCGSTIQVTWK
ncbi:MAG TPA: TadE/TadG family type IV pilus assembly protein [Candidatus Limnocylindrales bacterium]